MRIRPLRWWDVEVIEPLERQLFPADPWSAESFWAELAEGAGRSYVVAEDAGGEIVGYAGVSCPVRADGADAEVMTVAVAPAAQGAGVGRRLIEHLVAEASGRGAARLVLEVRADNDQAQSLYRSTGFESIGLRPAYYKPAPGAGESAAYVDAVVLARRLPVSVTP